MEDKLFSAELTVESVTTKDKRAVIATRLEAVKKRYKTVPRQLKTFNSKTAAKLHDKWEKIEAQVDPSTEGASDMLARWKDQAKDFRLIAIDGLTKKFYDLFWGLRSEVALIVAMYEFGDIQIFNSQLDWKQEQVAKIDTLVLRLSGPKKPSGTVLKLKVRKYDIAHAYQKMVAPMEEIADEILASMKQVTIPTSKSTRETRIKRFQQLFIIREKLTVLCQAVTPRQEIVKQNSTDD